MKIEGHGIGVLDALQQGCVKRREGCQRAEGGIDVEPEVFSPRAFGQSGEIIDRADIHCPGGADDHERCQARRAVLADCDAQGGEIHPVCGVDRDFSQIFDSQPGHIHGPGHAAMRALAGIGGEDLSL